MVESIVGAQFHAGGGVEDWRVVGDGARAYYVTGSFDKGLTLVNAIAEIAEELNHHPDLDLRYGALIVRVWTHEAKAVTNLDLEVAQRIQRAARTLDITADPSKVQSVQVAIDAHVIPDVLPFWKAVLGYEQVGDEDIIDSQGRSPAVWFQQMETPRAGRNRFHIDVYLGRDEAERRVSAGIAAGGHLVSEADAPSWWTLADAEGNEVDIAPWVDDEAPR